MGDKTTATKASHQQDMKTMSPAKQYELQIDELHPKQESVKEAKRWVVLHEFDKTQKQTREFLREALEEELANDPECTFHPQLSEMSQLIMRGSQYQGFLHRNECWQKSHQNKLEDTRKEIIAMETEAGNFAPVINKDQPVLEGPSVVTKKGVARYLNRLKRAEINKTLQHQKNPTINIRDSMAGSYTNAHMNAKSPYKKNGVTVPRSPFTRDHERKAQVETIVPQPQLQPEDKDLLRQKQQEEHEKFLNNVSLGPHYPPLSDTRYADAVNHLHNQILNLEVDGDNFGAK